MSIRPSPVNSRHMRIQCIMLEDPTISSAKFPSFVPSPFLPLQYRDWVSAPPRVRMETGLQIFLVPETAKKSNFTRHWRSPLYIFHSEPVATSWQFTNALEVYKQPISSTVRKGRLLAFWGYYKLGILKSAHEDRVPTSGTCPRYLRAH